MTRKHDKITIYELLIPQKCGMYLIVRVTNGSDIHGVIKRKIHRKYGL